MLAVALQGKTEQKERKRHFKYQMTHLMADIISPPDACWPPRLELLTAAVAALHYSDAAFRRSAPLADVWPISAPAHPNARVLIPGRFAGNPPEAISRFNLAVCPSVPSLFSSFCLHLPLSVAPVLSVGTQRRPAERNKRLGGKDKLKDKPA